MRVVFMLLVISTSGVLGARAWAQAPATATLTVGAECRDGTTWGGVQRSGACSHHGGVKRFDAPAPVGRVWVNMTSKVYHCPGDANYGTTKNGAYMAEDAAKKAGNRPSAGKYCS